MPDGLAQARIDPETGLLAPPGSEGTIMEIFEVGRMPPMQQHADGETPDAPLEEDPYEIY
jgi:membrane carboxypeptidase/penicillin-binding protein